ncbi:MAG: hypothetical protein KDA88_08900 [Planctomycetaceae bacterium]|nr:hypothetical protein [Planctomycetaceae bacterium]MCB9951254.1 hypothetical protein [Planctomycetaceae bacterium]
MSELPKLAAFSAQISTSFEMKGGDGLAFELTEAEALKDPFSETPVAPEACSRYSLLFLGPENVELQQGNYELKHPEMGELSLFMVPVNARQGRYEMEAIVNGAN